MIKHHRNYLKSTFNTAKQKAALSGPLPLWGRALYYHFAIAQ